MEYETTEQAQDRLLREANFEIGRLTAKLEMLQAEIDRLKNNKSICRLGGK